MQQRVTWSSFRSLRPFRRPLGEKCLRPLDEARPLLQGDRQAGNPVQTYRRRRSQGKIKHLGWALLLSTTACAADFEPGSRITNIRVLGGRIDTAEGERAYPRPGEEVDFRLFLAAPGFPLPSVSFALIACPELTLPSDVNQCAGAPFAQAIRPTPSTQAISVRMQIPSLEAFVDAERVQILGLVCPRAPLDASGFLEGTAAGDESPDSTQDPIEALLDACEPPSPETRIPFTFSIPLERDVEQNRHPSWASAVITLGGVPWEAPEDGIPATHCGEAGTSDLPQIGSAAREVIVDMRFPSEARERFLERDVITDEEIETTEALQVAHFSDVGEFERQFTIIEEENATRGLIAFAPPQLRDEEGVLLVDGPVLVNTYFTVRDQRGGFDLTRRQLCVVP